MYICKELLVCIYQAAPSWGQTAAEAIPVAVEGPVPTVSVTVHGSDVSSQCTVYCTTPLMVSRQASNILLDCLSS